MNKRQKTVHVRFGEDVGESGRSISVEDDASDLIRVYVGLLKRFHRYRIEIALHRPYQELLPRNGLSNLMESDCTVESIAEIPIGCAVVVNLFVRDSEVQQTLELGNEVKPVQITITANVLLPDMGTPVLKNGVHLIGKEKLIPSDEEM